jgi:hypothetical protein
MMKRVLVAVAGLLAFQSSGFSQASAPFFGGTLFDQSPVVSPWTSLESQDRFFFSSGFGSMRTTQEYLPRLDSSDSLSTAYMTSDSKNAVDRMVDWHAPSKIQFGGELGFLYGKSTGRYGREDIAGYIIGTVGNDKFSITAGYYRGETTYSNPRWRR